ncbi:dihydroorotase [Picrophilus oshimae]|uniref:Dihydroorotase n=1 Tax=Picrophilus torridus (strain ATCC 700027 / DSM 9790 / JCM 10055 / NBRC 100828 / KAW 2/3) TaxID=1122961 RepID=A0A8G2FWR1_PICTO|nr:dihydroorotase [Picrophilus oshimae]SMD30920.1 dihydroorotase [Picrophilus oshimae DSM 9789]
MIYAGNFYYKDHFEYLEIDVNNGIITSIKKNIPGKKIKLNGAVMPAGTDSHVHFRDPGETYKEDFSTGTMSAIFGGTTTIIDMPNNKIRIDNYQAFSDKLAIVSRKAYCDFGLYSMFTGDNSLIIDKRSTGIKIYMGNTTNTNGSDITNEEISKIKDLNVPVFFHAEDSECLKKHYFNAKNLKEYDKSRPVECEILSVEKIKNYDLNTKVIAHKTFIDKIEMLSEASPHHLLLNNDMDLGSYGKVNPPLRSRSAQSLLLNSYISGNFDILSSDHAPHSQNEKTDFEYALPGIIGVETRIPLMLALVSKKILPIDVFYKTAIYNPAKLFKIKKGVIDNGYYADFFSFDYHNIERLNDYKLHSKNPVSPFNGFDVIFPDSVVLRGDVIIDNREILDERSGKFINELNQSA